MVDDRTGDTEPPPDPGRAKRTPPTIDLEASEVLSARQKETGDAQPEPAHQGLAAASPWVVAAISGAVAASLVIGVGWILGWPAIPPTLPATPQVNAAVIDDLATRVAGVEAIASKPAAPSPDPAAAARIEALEKSLAALRGELTSARAQSEKLASALADVKTAPRENASPPDLAAINERIAQVERASRAQNAEIASGSAKPADDAPLRRVVTAALLDISVRQGDPYAAVLAAAKSLAPNPDALKPLESFAASGVPNANALNRELLALVPKLSPPAQDNSSTGSGIVDRLQAGAAKLVRIERTDTVGNDRGAVVARVTAAALRNNSAEARRELKTLEPADRSAAQSWLDKADARDAALAASHQFAGEAMAALSTPSN